LRLKYEKNEEKSGNYTPADRQLNKNLAIANRSRVSCTNDTSRTSPWPWNLR